MKNKILKNIRNKKKYFVKCYVIFNIIFNKFKVLMCLRIVFLYLLFKS